MTPGFAIAAAMLSGASIGLFVAHAQVAQRPPARSDWSPTTIAIGIIVTLLASTGMAFVVRVATDAESRATRLSARNRQRVDALERVNRIVARFDGSQPVQDVIQAVVDDISREFQITLVSMYLPTGRTQLTMVGVAGYPSPFHVIEHRRRHHRTRRRRPSRPSSSPTSSSTPTIARHATTFGARSRRRSSTAASCSAS